MRVTAKVKSRTRERLLESARKLFSKNGFEQTTTRDIAKAARVASGTVFNYFPNKEALGMSLIADAIAAADGDFIARRGGNESLDEDLFLLIVCGLRRLEPYRPFVAAVIETGLSPFARSSVCEEGQRLQVRHLEQVAEHVAAHGVDEPPSPLTMHLYWTLYLGVLAFWSKDESPHQEDTLAVLDQSLRLFAASLTYDFKSKPKAIKEADDGDRAITGAQSRRPEEPVAYALGSDSETRE